MCAPTKENCVLSFVFNIDTLKLTLSPVDWPRGGLLHSSDVNPPMNDRVEALEALCAKIHKQLPSFSYRYKFDHAARTATISRTDSG